MNFIELRKYGRLYRRGHTEISGAAKLLNSYLELPTDNVVPLSLSHGVDFGHCYSPMDIGSIEPIHWAYNECIYERAKDFKETLLIPHPWLLLKESTQTQMGSGTLIIGPPPGPENDSRLLQAISNLEYKNITILIKRCGNFMNSIPFWRENNINVDFVNCKTGDFYNPLFSLLSKYKRVIGYTFSSAIIFSSALGKDTYLIPGYRYRSYNLDNYLEYVNFSDQKARSIVNVFLHGSQEEKQHMALNILGNNISLDKESIRSSYATAVSNIRLPAHGLTKIPSFTRKLIYDLSLLLDKPGLTKINMIRLKQYAKIRRVPIIDMDELSVWQHGINAKNFTLTNTKYIKGVTEPGFAVDQY